MSSHYEVIIIGAGPSGLAAARSLHEAGVTEVLLLEREQQAGGVPRHCRHPTFGLQTFKRPMSGHVWAAKILAQVAPHAQIRTGTTVVAIKPGGELLVSSDQGLETLYAKRVILATGVRETPRHARLVSGLRPQGVLTAGALQQFIYLRGLTPGVRPVIVGSELVSFSTIWTLRSAGIRALALIDEHARPLAFRPSVWWARLMGVRVHLGAQITQISGAERVESIAFSDAQGTSHQLACDSIIFTGRFTGETTLIRNSHLAFEPASGRPLFDQDGRCSDQAYFAVGNMTHPADMGDQCYQEGQRVGHAVARSLQGQHPATQASAVPIVLDSTFRIAAPNVIALPNRCGATVTLNVRVNHYHKGDIVVRDGDRELYRAKHRCLPERRILLKDISLDGLTESSKLQITAD